MTKLKHESIILAKFKSGTTQMLSHLELSNLFKCKSRKIRQDLLYLSTLVCASNFKEIRVHVDLNQIQKEVLNRAYNEIKIITEHIRTCDFLYVPEAEERKYEHMLLQISDKRYLEYLSLKIIFAFFLKTGTLLQKSLFKFMNNGKGLFYLCDILSYQLNNPRLDNISFDLLENSPKKKTKIRPSSSPERLENKNK